MAMTDRDRLNDARADRNLADVAREPETWDVQPLSQPNPPINGHGRKG